ncbi:hypothetical protein D3C85_575020 [compost metagenome]
MGTKVFRSLELDFKSLITKSKLAFFKSGKPIIFPLTATLVFPIPLISKLGISMFFNLPDTLLLISSIALELLLKGLVSANFGTNNKTSLNPNLLFFKEALILNSPGFLEMNSLDG